MATQSTNFMEALDGIRDAIRAAADRSNYHFPHIRTGPYEEVLGFSSDEFIVLEDATGPNPYFSSTGVITDVLGRRIPGTRVETSFPLDLATLPTLFAWPDPQTSPYNKIPPDIDYQNTAPVGFSRQAYFWNAQDSIVTVGPAVPKIVTPLVNGSGQFWVAAVGVISQGTGKYEGVRGQQAYVGSSNIDPWPPTQEELFEVLAAGITVHSASWIKLVLDKWQHELAPKSLKAASPPKAKAKAGPKTAEANAEEPQAEETAGEAPAEEPKAEGLEAEEERKSGKRSSRK